MGNGEAPPIPRPHQILKTVFKVTQSGWYARCSAGWGRVRLYSLSYWDADMMQFTANYSNTTGRQASRLRAQAENLLKAASDLLDEQGRVPVERQERAYQLSNEAIGLLAQIRGLQAKK